MFKPSYKVCDSRVDVFEKTSFVERLGDLDRVRGEYYDDTKTLSPEAMCFVFKRDIEQTIRDRELPAIRCGIQVGTDRPIPIYTVTIHDIAAPLLQGFDDQALTDWTHVESSRGQLKLSDPACYVFEKIMQIFWRYNADRISLRGIYGHTHFSYQIRFADSLIEERLKRLCQPYKPPREVSIDNFLRAS